jgi:prolyl oligopeptidase
VFRQPKVDFNPNDYETRQVFYTSRDGTRVPMFIVSKKGLKLDGTNPTYLYGYGGFNISIPRDSRRPTWPGWRWAACTPWPTCAAAASTAKPGTKPAPG